MAMNQGTILVVDDDKNLLELIKMRLESSGYGVATALSEVGAREAIHDQAFDMAIVDLQLVHRDGISLMEELHEINPELPVMILTAHGTIESAVDAMKRGAFTYLTKPFDPRELTIQIERALENRRLTFEIERLRSLLKDKYEFSNIVARSEKMQRVLEQVHRISKTDSNVYLYGESGTGKELIAKAIHLSSARSNNPFVAVNCAALPENLLENELFGHEKGAFTGAVKNTQGLLTKADTGTFFFDEIGDMPLSIQAKLLRVLQDQQFYPLGRNKPVNVNVRVIVATNKDLEEEVRDGNFREDLFYRIHVIPIKLPALRERKEDIPVLADYFLKRFSEKTGKLVRGLTPLAMQRLMLYDWPGNVRELENALEYAVAMTHEDVITEDHILKTRGFVESIKTLKEARQSFEKEYLADLLKLTDGNVSKAAEHAGKYRADFYNLLKKYRINPADFKNR
ncbi:MAG: sigma-54-dependent Fis family transcriptional regulator [Nitrospiraceae bacterium]|nr:MAG: sigma-54-dependent Fis family transcriptional regulator [Nitrospiraceae bacterium]